MPLNQNNVTDDLDQAKVSVSDPATGLGAEVKTILGEKRLLVDTSSAGGIPVIPSDPVVYQDVYLLSGGSKDMTVNGSVTPVVFSAGPPAGQRWYVQNLNFIIQDNGAVKASDFGSQAGLTNGVLFEWQINSVDYELINLMDNADSLAVFTQSGWMGGTASGFVTDANYFNGHFPFRTPGTLIGDDGDVFKVTVRDNLSGLARMAVSIAYWRIV